ncbi:MAG: glutamate-cysteine ligase family protein [Acidobacteriota bacterium]|nr:glutamate-cysteine ligase family protein [Acidobacteriota bacterium]MDH3785923.1 glutamate-cysteine ligase family protein [Acidobacteriota bacterium]
MSASHPITRKRLLRYFMDACKPREDWLVGMEIERLGRREADGLPLPYENGDASVRRVIDALMEHRGGSRVLEGALPIGVDADWGTISLEPGGQVEWSSRPAEDLEKLGEQLDLHLDAMHRVGEQLGVRWLQTAIDPELPLDQMPWMPKSRYHIMRPYLGERGRLAHLMMTQSASIQCAYDFADPEDFRRKFRCGALLAPIATALFANSSLYEGRETGYQSYRQRVWQETDPDRCGLPDVVFDEGFGLESWLDYVLATPAIFLHRARGTVPAGGVPFRELMVLSGCDAIRDEDWETHISTIFTDVRSYTYIEVRSADGLPDALAFSVPSLWTGLLYDESALDAALAIGEAWDSGPRWRETMECFARDGIHGSIGGRENRDLILETLRIAADGLTRAGCVGDGTRAGDALAAIADHHGLKL